MSTALPHVLVVDDEPSVTLLCEYVLRDASYEVDAATTPSAAIQLMRERHYDAMIIDLVMPEGGGTQAILAARQFSPATPVIVMTAEPRHRVPPRIGMDLYLHKPFSSLSALEEIVADALAIASSRAHATAAAL